MSLLDLDRSRVKQQQTCVNLLQSIFQPTASIDGKINLCGRIFSSIIYAMALFYNVIFIAEDFKERTICILSRGFSCYCSQSQQLYSGLLLSMLVVAVATVCKRIAIDFSCQYLQSLKTLRSILFSSLRVQRNNHWPWIEIDQIRSTPPMKIPSKM